MTRPTQHAKELHIYAQLRRGTWFGGLAPSLAETLFATGRSESYEAGDVIYIEDRPSQGLLALVTGSVHFEKSDGSGQRFLLHVASPGYWFGEIAATGACSTVVTARAFTSCLIWRIPLHAVSQILDSEPEFFGALSLVMAGRFAALVETIGIMRKNSAVAQIAGRLAAMDRNCRECDSAVKIAILQMTQSDLADMTGHVRQTVNSAVKRLEQEGLIRVGHRQIEIRDPVRLAAYSSENA
jgi:CRP/FNR family cyclic AMP-dependent transcriptional regulator